MNLETILFIAIVILAIFSIALAIVNLIRLSSASLKISTLEEAVEKKTKEFDALKKERQSQVSQEALRKQEAAFAGSGAPVTPEPEHPAIEVVRSLPTGFKTIEMGEIQAKGTYEATDKNNFAEEPFLQPNDSMELVIFSETKKDTDFISAWKKLTAYMSVSNKPRVTINFRNVMFLYEKELVYLEKIQEVVMQAHGSLLFKDYHNELRPILLSRPTLARLITR
jgi:hypothetical protein